MSEWIDWNGGECPLADGTLIDVRYRDGGQINSIPANRLASGDGLRDASSAFWRTEGRRNDIIAYRMCQHEEVNPINDGGWIKCSDRMPDPDQEVIVWDKQRGKVQSGMIIKKGYARALGNVFVDFNEEDYTVKNVDFWQPLPAPPKGNDMEWKNLTSDTPPEGAPLLLSLNGEVQRRVYDYDESDGTWQDWHEECKPFKIADLGCCQWMTLPKTTKS